MENMFELLGTKTQVQDPPGGAQLQVMRDEGQRSRVQKARRE